MESSAIGHHLRMVNWPEEDDGEEEEPRQPLIERALLKLGRFVTGLIDWWL